MTTKKEFRCDLCGSKLDNTSDKTEGMGIEWVSFPENRIAVTSLNEAEHHLCLNCVKNIQKIEIK